jgi:hypothetical protein
LSLEKNISFEDSVISAHVEWWRYILIRYHHFQEYFFKSIMLLLSFLIYRWRGIVLESDLPVFWYWYVF